MIIRLIKVYAVHQGDDDRNSGTPAWFFYSKAQADAMAKGKGWYGGTCSSILTLSRWTRALLMRS
jgi:hypothetical protein